MTVLRHRWQRSAALTVAGAAAVAGAGLLTAAPASAHTPAWSVDCSSASVDLTAYNPAVTNTVTLSAGGKQVLGAETFKSDFHKKVTLPEHTSPLDVHLVVKAGDGDGFSRDEHKTSPVCGGTQKPSPSAPPSTPSPTSSPSHSAAPPAATPSDKPSKPRGDDDLAETGSSSATPVIAGVAAVVIVAGAGLVVATRRRRSAQR